MTTTPRGLSAPDPTASLRAHWAAQWPRALAAWGSSTRLHSPELLGAGEAPDGMGSFAWFSLAGTQVSIDLPMALDLGVEQYAVEVLAHEIGHHVLSPGDMLTAGRMAAQARLGLVDLDAAIPLVTNLWSDMLINDRLQMRAGLDMAGLAMRALGTARAPLGRLVGRAYEILWSLPAGVLAEAPSGLMPRPDGEAQVLARLVRAYADDPAGGVGGFAMLVRPLLWEAREQAQLQAEQQAEQQSPDVAPAAVRAGCAQHEPVGTPVPGLATDPSATRLPVHPALDPKVVGGAAPPTPEDTTGPTFDPTSTGVGSGGNTLTPADYAAVLQALGTSTDAESAAVAWYRENAARHLVPFPTTQADTVSEPLIAGHEAWEVGDDLADVDWNASVLRSPVVVPGITTLQRRTDDSDGHDLAEVPVDLDLYLDSSGSMPDPGRHAAPIALAGAILALSALRSGARVQATTWSGPRQVAGTVGFTRDSAAVLRAVVAHFGGSTAFPVQVLEATHLGPSAGRSHDGGTASRAAGERGRAAIRRRHIAVISDDGIVTMVGGTSWPPERPADPQSTVAARALRAAGGGGTLVLNTAVSDSYAELLPGYDVFFVTDWGDIVPFAKNLARTLWGRRT